MAYSSVSGAVARVILKVKRGDSIFCLQLALHSRADLIRPPLALTQRCSLNCFHFLAFKVVFVSLKNRLSRCGFSNVEGRAQLCLMKDICYDYRTESHIVLNAYCSIETNGDCPGGMFKSVEAGSNFLSTLKECHGTFFDHLNERHLRLKRNCLKIRFLGKGHL